MTCVDVRDNLSAYLDGELEREQAAAVESHLAGCEGCRAELESLRRVTETLHALRRRAAPAQIEREVVGRLERDALLPPGAAPVPSTRRRSFVLPIFGAAALAAAVLVAVGVYIRWNSETIREVGPVVAMTDESGRDTRSLGDEKSADRVRGAGSEQDKNADDWKKPALEDDGAVRGTMTKSGKTEEERGDLREEPLLSKAPAPSVNDLPAPAAPAVQPPSDMKLAEVQREENVPPAPEGAEVAARIEAPPARPEVLELKLVAADFAAERVRIVTLAESLNIRTVQAARLALDADEMRTPKAPGTDKGVAEAETTGRRPDGKEGGRVNDALDRVAQGARTDDEYEATVARLLDVIERSEAKDAASPVIVLAVPEEKLGPFVAKLAAYQEEGEGVKVKSVAPSSLRPNPTARKEAQIAKRTVPDPLDDFMKALDEAAAEDAERERMAQETAGRAGEGGLTGGKTRLSDTRGAAGPRDAETKDMAKTQTARPDHAGEVNPVPAPAKPAKATKYVYLQILLTRPAPAAK